MHFEDIGATTKGAVRTITINRPAKLNAIRGQTIEELEQAFRDAGQDNSIGVIVLTGEGERAFCSGGDVEWEKDGGLESLDWQLGNIILDCLKPVIARINGYAIASGNHLAYCCDLTIASEHSIFGQNGPRVASPAGGYPVTHLAGIIGHKRAREMWMLCRRYSAAQMLEWGLVNAVVPKEDLDAEVARWCDELLAMSPTSLKTIKHSFGQIIDRTGIQEVVEAVAPSFFQSGEQTEGATAFLEKRTPDFSRWR
jgi:2-ketocyclohexanecarboxyl-CoA hydrolase